MPAKITQPVLGMRRDENSNAVLSTDQTALQAYRTKRDAERLLYDRLNNIEDRLTRLERLLREAS